MLYFYLKYLMSCLSSFLGVLYLDRLNKSIRKSVCFRHDKETNNTKMNEYSKNEINYPKRTLSLNKLLN